MSVDVVGSPSPTGTYPKNDIEVGSRLGLFLGFGRIQAIGILNRDNYVAIRLKSVPDLV